MGIAQIPRSAIDQFASRCDLEGEEFDYFLDMVRCMDAIVMAQAAEKTTQTNRAEKVGRPLSPELFDALW